MRSMRTPSGEKMVTVEQYRSFYVDPSSLHRPHLNQIIAMHGFSKLYQQPKIVILKALDRIELMPPTRSTLDRPISRCAIPTVDEAAADLAVLGWDECPVRSLVSLASAEAVETDAPRVTDSSTAAGRRRAYRAPPADFVVRGRRPRSKRKRVSVNALLASSPRPSPPPYPPPSPPPPPLSPPPLCLLYS